LAQRLRDQLAGRLDYGASKSQIVPIILASIDKVMAAEQALKSRGWDLRAIRPPTVADGQCRLRVVLRSELSDDQIDRLAKDLIDVA
jgi:8-amino-7-oxononanoate synthase